MDNTFGSVCVLTNPSLPQQVAILAAFGRPEQCGVELSGATGVPEPFHLAYYRPFENAALAERIVHSVLEEQGLRAGVRREFFGVSAVDAQGLVDQVAERLDDAEASLEFAQAFVTKAQTYLEKPKPLISELEEALALLEHATSLGDPLAPFLGGGVAWDLARRRKSKAEVAAAFCERSRALFEVAGERGAPRGFAQSGRVALEMGEADAFLGLWVRYLDALPTDAAFPEEELDFILGMLYAEFYSGSQLDLPGHPLLKSQSKAVRDRAKALNAEPDFQKWLQRNVSSLQQQLLERGKLPAAVGVVLLALFVVKPALCMGLVAGVLFLFGIAGYVRKVSRTVRKAPKED
jgi:hypothetical protein